MKRVRTGAILLLSLLAGSVIVAGQSTDQRYPTAITADNISGTIGARNIGDSRKTDHYYAFDGKQGDIFINVVYENLNADIDIYLIDGLRLMTRIVALADHGLTETGRIVYLRKPERLLLRVSGRTPNDDPGKYTIKFAGSFVALSGNEYKDVPDLPKVSVPVTTQQRDADTKDRVVSAEPERNKRLEVVVEERVANSEEARPVPAPENTAAKPAATEKEPERSSPPASTRRSTSSRQRRTNNRANRPAEPAQPRIETKKQEPAAEAEQKLVVVFRDGAKIDVSMNDVLRFSLDSGMLVIVQKNGRIRRFQMKDIARFAVE